MALMIVTLFPIQTILVAETKVMLSTFAMTVLECSFAFTDPTGRINIILALCVLIKTFFTLTTLFLDVTTNLTGFCRGLAKVSLRAVFDGLTRLFKKILFKKRDWGYNFITVWKTVSG